MFSISSTGNLNINLNLFQIHFQTIQMMKVIVVFPAFISESETSTWPPSIQMGGNRWNILGFNFTKRYALYSVYKISMIITHTYRIYSYCASDAALILGRHSIGGGTQSSKYGIHIHTIQV
jgi:opacity protein-like surface antigen